jgi:cysteine desulfuration protein SufE
MGGETEIKRGINELQDEIIDEFEFLDDWTERYKHIIDQGRDLEKLDDQYKTDDLKIKGCQSNVYLHAYQENGRVYFEAESDAMIVQGLIAMLVKVLSGQKAEDIAQADLYFIDQIGMKEHLSPTRSNGLNAMVKQMKLYAAAFQQRNEQ